MGGWAVLAGNFLFVLTRLWLLWASYIHEGNAATSSFDSLTSVAGLRQSSAVAVMVVVVVILHRWLLLLWLVLLGGGWLLLLLVVCRRCWLQVECT